MSDERWIVVPNWDKFQHYSDRRPLWIKLYTELNSRDEWLDLTYAERGLLVTIWIEYARSGGVLDAVQMVRQMGTQKGLRFTARRTIDSLVQAGFVELSASKPLALARAREEKRRERPPKPPKKNGRVTGWRQVRGSHGITHVPDPFGTDRPPFEVRQ